MNIVYLFIRQMLTNSIDESHKKARPDEHNFIIHIFYIQQQLFHKVFFYYAGSLRAPSIGLKYC